MAEQGINNGGIFVNRTVSVAARNERDGRKKPEIRMKKIQEMPKDEANRWKLYLEGKLPTLSCVLGPI